VPRRVLLVTPFFSPQTHAPVFRIHKLAKYLNAYGWEPHVLTVDCNYNYNEDAALLSELPDGLRIHKARYVEPTLRGVRMALGGRDRSFRTLKSNGQMGAPSGGGVNGAGRPGIGERVYGWLRNHWLDAPDSYWPWVGPAVRLGERVVKEFDINAVVTTAPPYSSHVIGLQLKQRTGVRWVADLRDPGTYSRRMSSQAPRVFLEQRRIEKAALEKADAVTAAASSLALIFDDIYGSITSRPIQFIPSGLDEALLGERHTGSGYSFPYILFSGEFLPDYDISFFELFASVSKQFEMRGREIHLVIAGHAEINKRVLSGVIANTGLTERTVFTGQLPQAALYGLIKNAQAALLISGATSHWWTLFAKLVDYIALRKQVIAVVPDPSEARRALSVTGLGRFLDGSSEHRGEILIRALTEEPRPLTAEQDLECDRYTARRQVEDFARVLDAIQAQ
jgi:hypothetical protein